MYIFLTWCFHFVLFVALPAIGGLANQTATAGVGPYGPVWLMVPIMA